MAVGCEGSDSRDSSPAETTPTNTVDLLAPSTAPRPEIPRLKVVPNDQEDAANWVREYIPIYEDAYVICGGYVDVYSPTYDPRKLDTERFVVVESARRTSERAAWVAFQGCQDGTSDYPFPIPEVQHLQRNA